MAIKYLEQQPGYKDFGNKKDEKKINDKNNPFPDINSSSVITKSEQREGSVIGLLKQTNNQQEDKSPGSEIKLQNPLAQAQEDG